MWYAFSNDFILVQFKITKFYKFQVHFKLHQMYGYLFVVDVQGLYCTMLKENNLQF